MKKIILFLLFTILFLVDIDPQVDTAWVKRYNGSGNASDLAAGIVVDAEGNVYLTGSSTEASTGVDCTTIKYDSSGTEQWTANFNRLWDLSDVGYAIAVDNLGNIYVTGSSTGYSNGIDYVTIKYNSNGDTLWVRYYDGGVGGSDYAYAIAVDGEGNVYVTGESIGNNTYEDYVTVKYNSAGVEQWVQRYASPAQYAIDKPVAITIDSDGNVYVTGKSDGSGTYEDYATVKYNSSGAEQWVARYNGPGNTTDATYGIVVDDSGNVYVTGYSGGIGTGADYATIKYNSSGVEQWVARYSGSVSGENDKAFAIALDHQGYIYVTGVADFDFETIKYNSSGEEQWKTIYDGTNGYDQAERIFIDSENNIYVTGMSEGIGTNYDIATVKYNLSGNEQWTVRYDGPINGLDKACGIVADNLGNVYVTGNSQGQNGNLDYLTIKYISGTVGVENIYEIPILYQLYQNFPNPFNPRTTISWQSPVSGWQTLKIFDVLGNEVATLVDENKPAGKYEVEFNSVSLPSGVYFYQLNTVDPELGLGKVFIQTKKMILIK